MTNSKHFSALLIATFLLTFCTDLKCADNGIIANKQECFYKRDSFKKGACIALGTAIGAGFACLIIADRERLCSRVTTLTQEVADLTKKNADLRSELSIMTEAFLIPR